ncbi:MAG TPA: outer membrane lipoprotein-sorting protein [Bryobacteraceae bacterium]|nr:outer membrane lipoprotein-sorting protein [Bryobacteraceae bacterium]
MTKFLLPLVCLLGGALAHAESVETVLARMDKAAPSFHSMTANVHMTTHTAIINDTTSESGTFKMQRLKDGQVRAILDFSGETDSRQIGFLGRIVRIYYPKLNSYQDYDLGKNTDVLNQFLLLGFGSSGRDLANAYTISSEGTEKLGNRETTKLALVPKNPDVAKRLSKIEMWIPNDAAYPIQQEFYEPSGNYRIVTYTDINLRPAIHGKLELKLPPGVNKQSS